MLKHQQLQIVITMVIYDRILGTKLIYRIFCFSSKIESSIFKPPCLSILKIS